MISSYADALKYLYDNLPMFQKVGTAALRKDLTNTLRLCDALGNPQKRFRSIHVAGTNGKGSTSHMLASILQQAGYKTGLYTSPHLKSFTERIRVNGAEARPDYVVDFVNRMLPLMEELRPSFFEITVAMAFDYFAREGVDLAVVEVGMGGRLDSTNVITPFVSVITNISWDHKEHLGSTLQAIAQEKAGIIKPGVPVVVGERQAEVEDVFRSGAAALGVPIRFASDAYTCETREDGRMSIFKHGHLLFADIDLPMRGGYQRRNVPTVLATCDVLRAEVAISDDHIRTGLTQVVTTTGLKGRWQRLSERPLVVCDTGHNVDGISEIVREINKQHFARLFMVIGMVGDKDISGVLALLPREATYYFCQAKIPRALDAATLAQKAGDVGLHGYVVPDVNEALTMAIHEAAPDDFVFIGGSTFVVAEIEQL